MWFVQKLPAKLECDAIERDFQKLQQQQLVVSKKVLQLILQKHTTFNEEFARLEQGHYSFRTEHTFPLSQSQLNKFYRFFYVSFVAASYEISLT